MARKSTKATTTVEEVKVAETPAIEEVKEAPKKAGRKPRAAKKAEAAPVAEEKPKRKYTRRAKPVEAPVVEEPAAPALPGVVDLANMLREKIAGKDVSEVKEKIAVEIKVYGDYEALLYILIDEGSVSVEPYGYIGNNIHIDMPITDLIDVINGNYDFAAKAETGDFYAIGPLTQMIKVKKALF